MFIEAVLVGFRDLSGCIFESGEEGCFSSFRVLSDHIARHRFVLRERRWSCDLSTKDRDLYAGKPGLASS